MNEQVKRYREEEEKRAKVLDKLALEKYKKEGKKVGIESKVNKEAMVRFREWKNKKR